jgi:hypothetical protein
MRSESISNRTDFPGLLFWLHGQIFAPCESVFPLIHVGYAGGTPIDGGSRAMREQLPGRRKRKYLAFGARLQFK